MDAEKKKRCEDVFAVLCRALERRNWKYNKSKEKLFVSLSVTGEDIPMSLIIKIEPELEILALLSPFPVIFAEDKRLDGAIATCAATNHLTDGCFCYDITDGQITFYQTSSFKDGTVGEKLVQYMISNACITVDQFNDAFAALNQGDMSIEEYMEKYIS